MCYGHIQNYFTTVYIYYIVILIFIWYQYWKITTFVIFEASKITAFRVVYKALNLIYDILRALRYQILTLERQWSTRRKNQNKSASRSPRILVRKKFALPCSQKYHSDRFLCFRDFAKICFLLTRCLGGLRVRCVVSSRALITHVHGTEKCWEVGISWE